MKILLLSPYDAMSHRYWREGLVEQLQEHEFTTVTLPPRFFSWRFRGNSLTMSQDERLKFQYDLVIATSMTDLSALKGMCKTLANVPSILYFHENQFAYPDEAYFEEASANHLVERQITSIYSAISADQLVFNSEFNRQSFVRGVSQFLEKMPDGVPPGIRLSLEEKSQVIAVALRPRDVAETAKPSLLNIVWNHRWEHDKGVVELSNLVQSLLKTSLDFRFHIIGQSFRQVPEEIVACCEVLQQASKLGQKGFIKDRESYLRLLDDCHIVLSTARHEFQGLAVLEAIQAGCMPVVPDDLAYREFVSPRYRFRDLEDAVGMIEQIWEGEYDHQQKPVLPEQVSWDDVQRSWRELLQQL
ncbi:MAG: DUF3524 domain-containing protein [bacterium]